MWRNCQVRWVLGGSGGSVWVMGEWSVSEWSVGQWIVGVISVLKMYGLYGTDRQQQVKIELPS